MLSNSTMPLSFIEVAGAGLAVLITIVSVRLLQSVSSAERHLAIGLAVAPARSSATPQAAGTPAGARAIFSAPAGGDAAQQIFTQLNAYYAANSSQGNAIFWASLLAMIVGFAIVLFAIASAGLNSVTAIVAGVASVLSQFVAATFLIALRSTQQQATVYAQNMVELRLRDVAQNADANAVNLGLRLLDEISADRTNPANPTKAAIAIGVIVRSGHNDVEPIPIKTDEPDRGSPVIERRARPASVRFDDGETSASR